MVYGLLAMAVVFALVVANGAARRRRAGAEQRKWVAFAAARGWTYLARAPLRQDFRFLEVGSGHAAGRGFRLTIADRPCVLYEHIRLDGTGEAPASTRFVVLVVEGVRPHGDGMRIRAKDYSPIPGPQMRHVELESTELAERFVVEAPVSMPIERVREVLTPTAIVDLLTLANTDCYLGEYAEIGVDALLLASRGTIDPGDGDYLDATVAAAAPVVEKLTAR